MTLAIPGKSFYKLSAVLVALSLIASFWTPFIVIWKIALGLSALILLLDLFLLYRQEFPEITRSFQTSISLGVKRPINLSLYNPSKRLCMVDVFDHFPIELEAKGLPVQLRIAANQSAKIRYWVTAKARGRYQFMKVQLHLHSRWGFWERDLHLHVPDEIHVYPNFSAIPHLALLATDNRLSQMGIIKKPRRGQGQDFHQLREYREGDGIRQIDWKATSRVRKVIAREYQDERDQQVIFLLDSGHRMRAKDDELSHFDHTLNAMLMLAYVALRQGDAVGLSTFGGNNRWVSPKKGYHTIQDLLNTVYDLQAGTEAPDYTQAASDFMVRHKKRALVIILSNVRDEDSAELQAAVSLLRRRHLVLLASLREKALDDHLQQPPLDMQGALRSSAIHHYLQQRKTAFELLTNRGVLAVDVEPQELSVSLINSYLNIKSSGKL
ncbi:MAG: DUF58 domain-containing protein [Proteobacteria bacterium]|nr:MAG: DUF58 domain-containing protein [Pseudomonadota bacterium]